MINFIHNIQSLNIFRTSIVHLQERSYAVCCNLVCLGPSCCYGVEGSSWRWIIEVRNMLSYWMLWVKLIIKYCVSCWITDILQNDTRSIQYQIQYQKKSITAIHSSGVLYDVDWDLFTDVSGQLVGLIFQRLVSPRRNVGKNKNFKLMLCNITEERRPGL